MAATIRGSDRDHIRKTRDMKHDSTTTKFAIIPEWVLYHDGLSFAARAVYGALAAHADRDGRCWPSQATLAAKLHTSEATVKRAIAELRKAGAVTATPRHTRGRVKTSNLYQLHKDGPRRAGTPRPTDDESLEAPATQVTGDLHALETGLIHRSHMTPGHRSPVTCKPDPSEPDPSSVTPKGTFHHRHAADDGDNLDGIPQDRRTTLRGQLAEIGGIIANGGDFLDEKVQLRWDAFIADVVDATEGTEGVQVADALHCLLRDRWTLSARVADPYQAGRELNIMLATARNGGYQDKAG